MAPGAIYLWHAYCLRARLPFGVACKTSLIPRPITLHLPNPRPVLSHRVDSCLCLVLSPPHLAPRVHRPGSPATLVLPSVPVVVLHKTSRSLRRCWNVVPLPVPCSLSVIGWSRPQVERPPTSSVTLLRWCLVLPRVEVVVLPVVSTLVSSSLKFLQSLTRRLATKPKEPVVRPKPRSPVYCVQFVDRRVPTSLLKVTCRETLLVSSSCGFWLTVTFPTCRATCLLAQLLFKAP